MVERWKPRKLLFPKAHREDNNPASSCFMQLRLILNFCHLVIKYTWITNYFGSKCHNYGKSLVSWAPHSFVFNVFVFVCILTKPHDQNERTKVAHLSWILLHWTGALNWQIWMISVIRDGPSPMNWSIHQELATCEILIPWTMRIFALAVFLLAPASQIH